MSNNIDITALNLKSNTALETLYADGLSISEINLVENVGLTTISLINDDLLSVAYMWDEFNVYRGCLYVNNNFTFADSAGTTLRESYVLGSYVTSVGTTCSGVICATDYILSLGEERTHWKGAISWCESYGNGKWYLPNSDELKAIYNNKSALNKTLSACGGTTLGTSSYWSSTEPDSYFASTVDLSNGITTKLCPKTSTHQVRAVRAL